MSNPDIFRNVEGLVKQDSNIIAGLNFEFKGFVPEITSVDVEKDRDIELIKFFGDTYVPKKVSFISDGNQPRLAVIEGTQVDIATMHSPSGEWAGEKFLQQSFVRMLQVDPNDKKIITNFSSGLESINDIGRLGLSLESCQGSSLRQPGSVEITKIGPGLLIEAKLGKIKSNE